MKVLKWFIAGVIFGIISEILGWFIYAVLFLKWIEQVNHLYRPMDSLHMRIGMPLADIFSGLMISLVFALLYKGIPCKGIRKGLNFGLMLWLVHGLAGELFWYTMSPIPFMLVIAGWLHSLVLCSLGAMAIAGIYGKSLEIN